MSGNNSRPAASTPDKICDRNNWPNLRRDPRWIGWIGAQKVANKIDQASVPFKVTMLIAKPKHGTAQFYADDSCAVRSQKADGLVHYLWQVVEAGCRLNHDIIIARQPHAQNKFVSSQNSTAVKLAQRAGRQFQQRRKIPRLVGNFRQQKVHRRLGGNHGLSGREKLLKLKRKLSAIFPRGCTHVEL